jgi:putative tributyrin esterase
MRKMNEHRTAGVLGKGESVIPAVKRSALGNRSPKTVLLCCVLFASAQPFAVNQVPSPGPVSAPQVVLKDASFHSVSLERDVHYQVLFPRDYAQRGRVPVLYLLHGLYGNDRDWETKTALEKYAENLRLLIVMPDADDSWYTNSATVSADRFEDYIVKDLISEIDGKYRTIRERNGRAIAGLSMGGYGAVKFALKDPELFAFAGSLSGALNAPRDLGTLRPDFRAKLFEVFGGESSRLRTANDVFLMLNKSSQTPYPYIYLACGTADFLLETNRAFAQQLSSNHIAYEYHETPGDHAWEYWDGALEPLLRAVAGKLTIDAANSKVAPHHQ